MIGDNKQNTSPNISTTLKPKSSWLKKILQALLILVLLTPILLYIAMYLALSGGIIGAIQELKPQPDPKSSSLESKRASAVAAISKEFSLIEQANQFVPNASSLHDICYKGNHDFKRSDSFAYKCTMRMTKFYGFNEELGNKMINIEKSLYALDWKYEYPNEQYPMAKTASEYLQETQDFNKNPAVLNIQLKGISIKEKLPPKLRWSSYNDYIKNYGKYRIQFDFENSEDKSFSEPETPWQITDLENAQKIFGIYNDFYETSLFVDVKSVYEQLTSSNKYVVAVSIEVDYFKN